MKRSAYTLIELLISSALILLLLTLMWGIVSTIEVGQSRGAQMVSRSSSAREFAKQFTADIAAAIQDTRSASGRSQPSGDDDVRRFGLFGESNSLRLDVFRACPIVVEQIDVEENRLEAMGADVVKTPKLPELKTVVYEASTVPGGGITRSEWDYHLSLRTGEASFKTQFREAVAFSFRYFDGSTWRDTWDSIASESLPTAVEATITWQLPKTSNTSTQHIVAYLPASSLQGHEDFVRARPPAPPAPPPSISLTDVTLPPPPAFPSPPQTTEPKPPSYERRWMRGAMQ
ncbi:MAG: type II secretion system protein GspJ [Thermoguttaceae bacterium]